MGVFRSMRQVNKEAKQLRGNWDPAEQTRRGLRMMQAATAQLAEQNAAAELATTGVPGVAAILAARDTGTRIDFQPMVELDLLVTAPGRPPYPVTTSTVVPVVGQGRLQPGGQLAVRVDPALPDRVAVMWSESTAR